jgi:hypothetical protein
MRKAVSDGGELIMDQYNGALRLMSRSVISRVIVVPGTVSSPVCGALIESASEVGNDVCRRRCLAGRCSGGCGCAKDRGPGRQTRLSAQRFTARQPCQLLTNFRPWVSKVCHLVDYRQLATKRGGLTRFEHDAQCGVAAGPLSCGLRWAW